MVQILYGVDACHRNSIVDRDLKAHNLLISSDGVLKLADFGQAKILLAPGSVSVDNNQQPYEQSTPDEGYPSQLNPIRKQGDLDQELLRESDELRSRSLDDIDRDSNVQDGDISCLATCTTSDIGDPLKGSYSYDIEEGETDGFAPLTSCGGTRWYRASELLYGSTSYGPKIDFWSLGCSFVEFLSLEPLFPGNSDIDQLGRIFCVLGNLSEEVWPGCADLR
ncbi:cyclin-dependent kinase F-1-like [Lycium ferocissimum]|uniref:cyclin-dependent kinase F-1-like n=1 Tax=Lycium ferocissimum TaxID=112874 RepID=UPI00281586E0|nr:cyclin-dependent kinase F-1-like [Lycium ferocissimum]